MSKIYIAGFIALLILLSWGVYRKVSRPDIVSRVEKNLERELRIHDDALSTIVNSEINRVWGARDLHCFAFEGGQLVAWSTNSFAADISWAGKQGERKFVKTLRGDFIATTTNVKGGFIVSVIPLVERYRITNKYLGPAWNTNVFGDARPILSGSPAGGAVPVSVHTSGGEAQPLFYVGLDVGGGRRDALSLVLISLAVALGIFLIGMQMWTLHTRKKYAHVMVVLVAGIGTVRMLMIAFNFPRDWVLTPVFDSTTFASSYFNPGIGDLFLNSLYVLSFTVYLFYCFSKSRMLKAVLKTEGIKRQLIAAIAITIALFGFLFPYLFYETIFHNSFITLDWTQSLNLDTVRVVAFVSALSGSVSAFLFCHVWLTLAVHLSRGALRFFAFTLLPGALLFYVYYYTQDHHYQITLVTGVAYAAVLYFTGWYRGLSIAPAVTYLYVIVAIAFLALQASFATRRFSEERSAVLQYRFGQSFLVERDELGEYLLQQASTAIGADPFIQTSISSPFSSRNSIRSKVKQVYLSNYFDRYDVQIHMFSPAGEPLDNQSRVEFGSYVQEYVNQVGTAGPHGIYFVNQSDARYDKQYVAVAPVARQGRALGYITLVLSLKKIVPQSVFPELLVDNRFAELFSSDQYSYAIFQGSDVVSSFGTYNYESDFDLAWLSAQSGLAGIEWEGKRHVIVEGEGERRAVITTNLYPNFYLASNLAFWIMLGVVVVTAGFSIHALVRFRSFRLNYATRIQIIVLLAFVIPLFVISAITLTWTSATAEQQLRQDFADRARRLAERVAPQMEAFLLAGNDDQRQLEDFLIESSRLSGVDASIYSRSGKLVATNQLQIFDNVIVSNLVNPAAFPKMMANNTSFIEEERIGKLSYNNAYHILRSPGSGESLGLLSIPFFDSGYSLERSRIDILANVMIALTIILLFFTALSLAATRWLTFPLRMITRSLSRTTLKEENKLLDWRSDDEIGLMVSEYNKMVLNLETSKLELARRQKESAWREMAQQVAHEIKNPLTPMKLALQQMESLVRSNELSREKAGQSLKNVLAQLEILNEIATSFSSFARMPAPLLEKLEILGLVDKVVALYAGHPSGNVTFKRPSDEIWIMGDQQLLSRVFSNLILNGLQSGQGRPVSVALAAERRDGHVVLSFTDTGAGIPAELRDKVFLPHFTTKQSGSGLGLAISRQGIEQSGGQIWYESGPGGTTFFVSLPVHNN